MILVTLGTQDKSFKRLLDYIAKEIDNGTIKEKVVVQAGYTKYETNKMDVFDLIPMQEFDKLVKECSILITHGGVGSILNGIKNNKVVIAVPRLKKYHEHTNDHQMQVVSELARQGYILKYDDNFHELLYRAKKFNPKKWTSNTHNVIKVLEDYISLN